MVTEKVLRKALWATVVFNAGAVLMTLLPERFEQVMAMPPAAPPFHRAMVAFFIALFGACYAWLAMRPVIDRPLLTVGVIGKTGAFVLAVWFWLAGQLPLPIVLAGSIDLAFAAIFAAWLLGDEGRRI